MFWKFGFHDTSTLDALLDKEEVSLEAILDEDDLLQECKSQNTRLFDFFQRVDVLLRLFGYVTGTIEGEGQAKYRYPYIATEVLCSEIWSIVETCLNNADELLAPFWDSVLDRDPEELRSQAVIATHLAKINATFLVKKPGEMLKFIQSQPSIIQRLLNQLETPAIVDLLVRIIQVDEYAAGVGVLEWLSEERLIPRLVDLLSPYHTSSLHSVVSELIKGIISMSAPSPGAGISEGMQNGPASNLFARQLADKENIDKLAGFMLNDYSFKIGPNKNFREEADPVKKLIACQDTSTTSQAPSLLPVPNLDSIISSGTQAISIIVELIRKNNSDYFEPYLFHTIRNRLIQVQQHLHVQNDGCRDALEQTFNEMVEKMGVVHLGPMLEIMCDRFEQFQHLLHDPRSSEATIMTSVGPLRPLTFERFRICELYAELLHCSNMSLLNRPPEYDDLYDSEGRLRGGLSALEELARVIAIGNGSDEQGNMDADTDEMEPAQELPVSLASADLSNLHYSDEDDDMSAGDDHSSGDVDGMEEIDMSDETNFASPPPISPREEEVEEMPPLIVPSSPNATSTSDYATQDVVRAKRPLSIIESERPSASRPASAGSRRSSKRYSTLEIPYRMPVGERLKKRFQETKVLSTLLDLFFAFPWNNFLHSVVYDVLHQILTGRVDSGMNRELTIALFRDARLLYRIVKAQKENDAESVKPGHVRLGYMGHLTLVSEDVIAALEHYPPDLRHLLARYAPQPDWDEYVGGRYHETKSRDTSLLGGGKPVVVSGMTRGATKWKVDETEIGPAVPSPVNGTGSSYETPSEFKEEFRGAARLVRGSSTDFGVAAAAVPDDDDDDDDEIGTSGPPQFASYLAQAMSTHISSSPDDNSDDDDDEDDGGWLSHKFELGNPPVSARNHSAGRRPLNPAQFDDTLNHTTYGSSADGNMFDDNFSLDDDRYGPFTDASTAPPSAPDGNMFSFANVGDGTEDGSFDNFADFGDFQSGDGDLTPTGGSWTFAGDASISSGSDDVEVIEADRLSDSNSPQDKRTDTHRS